MQRHLAGLAISPPETHDRICSDTLHVCFKVIADIAPLMEHCLCLLVIPDIEISHATCVHPRHDFVPCVVVQLHVLLHELGLALDHAGEVLCRAHLGLQ